MLLFHIHHLVYSCTNNCCGTTENTPPAAHGHVESTPYTWYTCARHGERMLGWIQSIDSVLVWSYHLMMNKVYAWCLCVRKSIRITSLRFFISDELWDVKPVLFGWRTLHTAAAVLALWYCIRYLYTSPGYVPRPLSLSRRGGGSFA